MFPDRPSGWPWRYELLKTMAIASFMILSPKTFAQGDLRGCCVLTPQPMAQLNPEFVYRGATTTHPLHYPDNYRVWTYGIPELLDLAHSREGLSYTIQTLADQQVPFLLPEGLVITNPEFRTPSFDLGFLNESQFDMVSFWTSAQHWAMEDPDYWYGINELYDQGYRPVVRHNILGLPKDTIVMQRPGAPMPGTGQLPTFIDGNLVGKSSLSAGVVHCIDDSLWLSTIPPALSEKLPTYHRYLYEMAMPNLDEEVATFLASGDQAGLWNVHDESIPESIGSISESFPEGVRYETALDELPFDPQGKSISADPTPQSIHSDIIVVSRDPGAPGQLRVDRLTPAQRLKSKAPEVQLRYQRVRAIWRRQRLRASVRNELRRGAAGGGRLLRGAGAGLAVQFGASEGLKATTGLDDDTANMVVMPLSEAVGMMAVDLALPTVGTTTSTAAAGTTAATTGVGATVASGAVGGLAVVTEATRRSANQHHLKLLYDQNSMQIGTQITIYLMRRNAHLRDLGEIGQAELIQRNQALADSARKEGERTTEEAQWISKRYRNIATACFGTVGSAWDHWTGSI